MNDDFGRDSYWAFDPDGEIGPQLQSIQTRTAVTLSASFPLVTPAGTLYRHTPGAPRRLWGPACRRRLLRRNGTHDGLRHRRRGSPDLSGRQRHADHRRLHLERSVVVSGTARDAQWDSDPTGPAIEAVGDERQTRRTGEHAVRPAAGIPALAVRGRGHPHRDRRRALGRTDRKLTPPGCSNCMGSPRPTSWPPAKPSSTVIRRRSSVTIVFARYLSVGSCRNAVIGDPRSAGGSRSYRRTEWTTLPDAISRPSARDRPTSLRRSIGARTRKIILDGEIMLA